MNVATARLTWRQTAPWASDITLILSSAAVAATTFDIRFDGVWSSDIRSLSITMGPGGSTTRTIRVNAGMIGVDRAWFTTTGISSRTFNNGGSGTNITVQGGLIPTGNGAADLGSGANRWRTIFASRRRDGNRLKR